MHKLSPMLNPSRVAVIGGSGARNRLAGTVVHNLVTSGFRGSVHPVIPGAETLHELMCYPDLAGLPAPPDLGVICAPAPQVPALVRACGEAGVWGVIVISAGFREIGAAGRALEAAVAREASRFPDMRILGPNCLGVIVPRIGLNATFATGMPKAGHVAFVSQSGALCTTVLDWALDQDIGFSYFISVGNSIDVDFGDLIDYVGQDGETRSIILYIESIARARRFMSAARAFARRKPIVAYKAGRYPESAAAASSHTGALAAEDEVYDAAFRRAGIARVHDIGEIFDCAELIGRSQTPTGDRLAIVTNAGGPGVMAADALIEARGTLARLSETTLAALGAILPPFWSHRNPVDVLGDAPVDRVARTVDVVLADPQVDALLVMLAPTSVTDPTLTASRIAEIARGARKPLLAAWLGGASMREGARILEQADIATYETPERAVRAFMTLVDYARNVEMIYETPRDIPVEFSLDGSPREALAALAPERGDTLDETASKRFLARCGVRVIMPREAHTADEAAAVAREIGYPVVVKILSPDITHKSDVDGVILDLRDEAMVRSAFERIVATARGRRPEARVEGVTVQRMVDTRDGVELLLGAKKDPTFGAVVLAGLGGTSAELFKDRALGLPPLNERLARHMLESLTIWPLLTGYRGRPPVNLDQLLEAIMRLSYLAAECPEIRELDINPVLATPREVVALDARIVIDREAIGAPVKPYAHLALPPYPAQYVRRATLGDATRVLLRPIKPEDEPLWFDLLGRCSPDSIYARFRYFFRWSSHDVAARFCHIDYDRELAIVAEVAPGGVRTLVGVGRLVANPDHDEAEFAVLIADAWQNRGLGGLLTDYSTEIARAWGLKRLTAQTTWDNTRVLALFRKRAFRLTTAPDAGGVIDVSKDLTVV